MRSVTMPSPISQDAIKGSRLTDKRSPMITVHSRHNELFFVYVLTFIITILSVNSERIVCSNERRP